MDVEYIEDFINEDRYRVFLTKTIGRYNVILANNRIYEIFFKKNKLLKCKDNFERLKNYVISLELIFADFNTIENLNSLCIIEKTTTKSEMKIAKLLDYLKNCKYSENE